MRQIRPSGLMSGEGERSIWPSPQATAPFLDFTDNEAPDRRKHEKSRRLDGKMRIADDRAPMNWIALSLCAASALVGFASPARADFSSCVASLRATRRATAFPALDVAFGGLQPDMKVLEFQKEQPEFKTPVWDYLAALVDEERVSDGKARMAQYASALATRRAAFWRQPLCARRVMGGRNGLRPLDGQAAARAIAEHIGLPWRTAGLFSPRTDGDPQDPRQRRRRRRSA